MEQKGLRSLSATMYLRVEGPLRTTILPSEVPCERGQVLRLSQTGGPSNLAGFLLFSFAITPRRCHQKTINPDGSVSSWFKAKPMKPAGPLRRFLSAGCCGQSRTGVTSHSAANRVGLSSLDPLNGCSVSFHTIPQRVSSKKGGQTNK